MKRIKSFFILPDTFNDIDENKYRQSEIANVFLIAYLVSFLISAFLNLLYTHYVFSLFECVLSLIILWCRWLLLHKQKINFVSWFSTFILGLLTIALIFYRNGVQQSYVNVLMFPIAAITLLGYRKGTIISLVYTGIILHSVYYGSNNWEIRSPDEMYINLSIALIGTITTMIYIDYTKDCAFQRIASLSYKDSLTGIWNRRKLDELIEDYHFRYENTGTPYSMLLIDVDYFKQVNDTYGHKKGDEVLIALVNKISNNLESYEILLRWGGEEFAILLPDTDDEMARKRAILLNDEINKSILADIKNITISIGYGCIEEINNHNYERLFSKIDEALYIAKSEGRNRIVSIND